MKKLISLLSCLIFICCLGGTLAADEVGFSDIKDFSEGLAAAKSGIYWGYIDENGETIIPFVYREAFSFSEGFAVVRKDRFYGYIDQTGTEVIPMQYTVAESFSEGYAVVASDGKFGAVDRAGKTVLPFQYDKMESFREGYALSFKDGGYHYVRPNGTWLYSVSQLVYAESFQNGIAYVEDSVGNRFFIDKNGWHAFAPVYDWISPFTDGYALYMSNGGYGILNKSGTNATGSMYAVAEDNGAGYILVSNEGYSGYFEKASGKFTMALGYQSVSPPAEGRMLVEKDNRYSFVNTNFTSAINSVYIYAESFSQGRALIVKNEMYGFIDTKGDIVIACEYDDATSFSEGLSIVRSEGKFGCIDTFGNIVIPLDYSSIADFKNGITIAVKNGKHFVLKNPLLYKTTKAAVPTSALIEVNDVLINAEVYNIEGSNYFKLRDLAYLMNGTAKRFSVLYDQTQKTITLTTNQNYEVTGGEMLISGIKTPRTAMPSDANMYLGTQKLSISAYNIGGNNYYRLRDIAKVINVGVIWDNDRKLISIETAKPYAEIE